MTLIHVLKNLSVFSKRKREVLDAFSEGKSDLVEVIKNLNLSNPALYQVITTYSKYKIKDAFDIICKENGIELDDELPPKIEKAYMKKVDKTVLLLEKERRKYKKGLNIKTAVDKIGKIKI